MLRWALYEAAPEPTWLCASPPAVLLGDAAHAVAPDVGRGANEALLDAWCLATELCRPGSTLLGAAAAYEPTAHTSARTPHPATRPLLTAARALCGRYEAERHAATSELMAESCKQMATFCDADAGRFRAAELCVPRIGLMEHGLGAELSREPAPQAWPACVQIV